MDVGVDVEGFVHISEISNQYVKDITSVLSKGETVKVKIISVDPIKKRIALSIKQVNDRPN